MSLLVQIGEDDGGRSRGASVFPLIASTVPWVCPKGVPFYRRNVYEWVGMTKWKMPG